MRRRNPSVYGRLSFLQNSIRHYRGKWIKINNPSFLDREVTFHGQPHSHFVIKQIFVFLIIRALQTLLITRALLR